MGEYHRQKSNIPGTRHPPFRGRVASAALPVHLKEWRRPRAAGQRYRLVPVRRFGGCVLSFMGLLSGCAHYGAMPLAPAHSADEFAARRLTDVRLQGDLLRLLPQTAAWPPSDWSRAELLAVALVQNPQLAVARAQVKAAQSRETTASQAPNPDLTLESEYARHDAHPWLYGIGLNWLLRSPERRRLEAQIAGIDTDNARLQLMEQAWTVRSALVAALSDWESSRRRLYLLERLAAAQDRLLVVEETRVHAGEDAPSEILICRQARIQTEQQQAQSQISVAAAQAAAAKALGLPPEALDGARITWPDWGDPPPVDESTGREARERALLSRADLGQAIDEYAAAEAKLQLAVARQYPQFELSPGYYWDHGIAKFPFDLGLTLPFNRNRGEIAEAGAGRELAGRRMLALQADIYGEIVTAERAEGAARDGSDAAGRQLQAARRRLQAADLGLRVGAVDAREQVGAQVLSMQAELEVLQMRSQLQSSRNDLENALHAPVSGPELELAKSMPSMVSGDGS